MSLCADYQKHFRMQRRDMGDHARHYLTGLLGRNVRKSIGRIEEELPDSNYQGLQQFISDSPWDDQALLRQVRGEAEALLGVIMITVGKLPCNVSSACSLMAALRCRNVAQGNSERHRSMVVESSA